MTAFWAKTTGEGAPGISVESHLKNVGAVARELARLQLDLAGATDITADEVAFLAALHDIGKISPGFQRKCDSWLRANGIDQLAAACRWDAEMESDHGRVTQAVVQQVLLSMGLESRKAAAHLAAVIGAHHGRVPVPPTERGVALPRGIAEARSGIDWEGGRAAVVAAVASEFPCRVERLSSQGSSPLLFWIAGLTTVADWIGSDEDFFPPDADPGDEQRIASARRAVSEIGLTNPPVATGLSFAQLFKLAGAEPNAMQQRAVETITGPGVFLIEAPMGTGKTEAALWAAYELLQAGKARGLYFALPTQATSNRIHLRVAEFVQRIAPAAASSRLIHGNSWLLEESSPVSTEASGPGSRIDDARAGEDWFASAKRALLAPFGVGTVDQALLGVVAARHFFVRGFALAGKVVIIDEVHSYDLYTGTLVDKLVSMLVEIGATVIILSATLSGARRDQLVAGIPTGGVAPEAQPYPLIAGLGRAGGIATASCSPTVDRPIEVSFAEQQEVAGEALRLAARGGIVLWIANTVDEAQRQYRELSGFAAGRFPVGLLHSRFPFFRREALEQEWMERLGKGDSARCGSILVATQIVEQSVDLDADLMITELAPTDMLLQRLGRLWRHPRGRRPVERPAFRILAEAVALARLRDLDAPSIREAFGSKANVYAPYVLLRSLEAWQPRTEILVPSQIRTLIEATYAVRSDEPPGWRELREEMERAAEVHRRLALQSANLWTVSLDDKEGVQTRLNELPTVDLVLSRAVSGKRARFLDGASATLGSAFDVATARVIHRNVVRVPRYWFTKVTGHAAVEQYLPGPHTLGLVDGDGVIEVSGLGTRGALRWSPEMGVFNEKE